MKYYSALILAAILLSCNSPQKKSSDSAKPKQTTSELIDKAAGTFKGLYTYGDEVNTFWDCETGKKFRVIDSLGLLKIPYQKVLRSFPYPYESLYAEVKGYLSVKSNMGYVAEQEVALVVTEVIRIEVKTFRTDCYTYEFIAVGNEPFWSVDIIPNEKLIVLKDVAEDKVYLFPYQTGVVSGTSIRYQTRNDLKETLTLHFKKESCSDGMSDNVYFYSAEVNIYGKVLKGCAIKKGDIIRQNH